MENFKQQATHFLQMHYDVRVPNGYSKISKACLGDDYFLSIGLIENLDDCSHRIRDNDIGKGTFRIGLDNKGLYLEKVYHRLSCEPTQEHCAMSLQSVPYRLIRGKNYEELVNKFDKYLTRYLDFVNEKVKEGNIYRQKEYDQKYFEFN